MKQVLYMAAELIKHPGVEGRELPLKPVAVFNGIECEHIFVSAGRIENFMNHISRFNSVADCSTAPHLRKNLLMMRQKLLQNSHHLQIAN